jgi:hypothetical protein
MSHADFARHQAFALIEIMKKAVGNGAASNQELENATTGIKQALEALKNARVFAQQESDVLQRELVPNLSELFSSSYAAEVSDSITAINVANVAVTAWANFLHNAIVELELILSSLYKNRDTQLNKSAYYLKDAAESIQTYGNKF